MTSGVRVKLTGSREHQAAAITGSMRSSAYLSAHRRRSAHAADSPRRLIHRGGEPKARRAAIATYSAPGRLTPETHLEP